MKKLVYICLSVCLLSACSSDSESSDNEKADTPKETKETKDSTSQGSVEAVIPDDMTGDILPCDCYKSTIELMDRAMNNEDVEAEMLGVDQVCSELAAKIGEEDFKTEMELCARVDTLDVDISGLTVCDCKTQIMSMMDRALEMETNEALAGEFRLIQDKCAVLEAQMGSSKYKADLKDCN